MLTKITIRNFKRFGNVEIELGDPVVFIGPNDSGKTTALQAIALWELGLKRWYEKRGGKSAPEHRPGVTINRRDLVAIPVPSANLLWRNLRVRKSAKGNRRAGTKNVRLEIICEGVTNAKVWTCGLEYDYANEESLYCRPLRLAGGKKPPRMPVPKEATNINVAFLPPMSGLADREFVKQPGEISFLIGQGRTAEVLRNLCYQLIARSNGSDTWEKICQRMKDLFGLQLNRPRYIPERSEIEMSYQTKSGVTLGLSSSGRGFQQTLMLLAYLGANPGSVILVDEPDAHLEILRQQQIYQIITEMAREQSSQIIAASHSEVVLNQAAARDVVVAFLGKPHRIDDRGSQLLKSLKDIGFEHYYQAEQTGWVLYVEGSTDLAILQAFAEKLNHPAQAALERPFVYYVSSNTPQRARDHFYGLREAKLDLVGFALFDRLNKTLFDGGRLKQYVWQKREIENYLCQPEVLLAYARDMGQRQFPGPLFAAPMASQWETVMKETIAEFEMALNTLGKGSPWSPDIKASDDFLDPLFKAFYKKLSLPNLMRKTDYHQLARFVPEDQIDREVSHVLDMIEHVSKQAKPV